MNNTLVCQEESLSQITIPYKCEQKQYYLDNDKRCLYRQFRKRVGIHRAGGNFPAMVARQHYEKRKYIVLDDFCLIRKPKQRETDVGFWIISSFFGEERVRKVIRKAEAALVSQGMGRGGDPDLFVFRKDRSQCFFVEAKEPPDRLRPNQCILIPLIEKYLCPVIIARIIRTEAY
jgi:VRR-NUC domain